MYKRRNPKVIGRGITQNEIMAIAFAEEQLRINASNSGADRGRLAKVENSTVNRPDFACRDLLPVCREERIRRDRYLVPEDVAGRYTSQIEIGMSAEADRSGLAGYRLQRQPKRVPLH